MRSLFLVTLGPVQDFIASARRTRDLHFGSWFLSELSRAAASEIHQQKGTLIFPAPEKPKEQLKFGAQFNIANRILAIIEQPPTVLAKQVENAVFQCLDYIRKEAYKDINLPDKEQKTAKAQIKDLVELVWVALPLPNDKDYHDVRNQLESLLAARKNTHTFTQVTWGGNVPKSSLDGHLESVIPIDEYPKDNADDTQKRKALNKLYEKYKVGGLGERLSGVDLLKRSGQTAFDKHFPSTSHIAALPFLQRMRQIKETGGQHTLHSEWNDYVAYLDALTVIPIREQFAHAPRYHPILDYYDGSLLFEGRLLDVLLIPSTNATNNKDFQHAQQAQQKFYTALDKQFEKVNLDKRRPSTYYALLQADGDNMGTLIDALVAPKENEQPSDAPPHERHRKLSQALSRFAERVREIVNDDHHGALIYSGGDDVLAFLPLHTVLACATKLKTSFSAALEGLAEEAGCDPPTLSVGIAIVHHLEPLREARRLAHDAEKKAKRMPGKNALAITVSKRSGEDYSVVGTWGNIDERLSKLINYCREANIPAGMAYELRDMALRLTVSKEDKLYETLQQVKLLDAQRILLRKLTMPAGRLSPEQIKGIETFLHNELNPPPEKQEANELNPPPKGQEANETTLQNTKQEKGKSKARVSVETFINELVIAQMLAQAAELAQQ